MGSSKSGRERENRSEKARAFETESRGERERDRKRERVNARATDRARDRHSARETARERVLVRVCEREDHRTQTMLGHIALRHGLQTS